MPASQIAARDVRQTARAVVGTGRRAGALAASLAVTVTLTSLGAQGTICDVPSVQAKAPGGTTIASATVVEASATMPRHCLVEGSAASADNAVGFRLALPTSWNGKFLFLGVGGLGGSTANPAPGLARGYATASTDTGHKASEPDWAASRAKEIDYGYRGTHVAALATKALASGFFGTAPRFSYFQGCSNGGRQALMEVQRYPEDFDGVIGGHPATGTPMQVGRAIVYQKMLASPEHYLTGEAIELLSAATLQACDAADGLADGLVSEPLRCTFDPAALACKSGQTSGCLTSGQLEVVQQVYAGVKLHGGEVYAHGFPPGHEGGPTGWRQWISGTEAPARATDGALAYTGKTLPAGYGLMDFNFRFLSLESDDPAFTWRSFNPARDLARMKTMTEILSPLDPDLRPFKTRGGKLLLYHGWADPGISALGTLAYHDAVVKAVGGTAAANEFLRTYFVPGMHHCGGGPGPNQFDMLAALEEWVERGLAPGPITASRIVEGRTERTRPLCPHPQVARYAGSGSRDDAANFSCTTGG